MRLSIIVPAYQVETTLDRCLQSMVNQPFNEWEMILVDDGSTDNTPTLCDAWALRDRRIHVIHKPNGGLSDARNAGLDVAQGEYITFVDSDDWISDNPYGVLLNMKQAYAIVEYPAEAVGPRGFISSEPATYTDMERYWLDARAYQHCYAWNKLYRRDLFDSVRFPVGRVFEDVEVLPRLLKTADSVHIVTTGCYHYTLNPSGITQQATGTEMLMLLEHHLDTLTQWCDDRYYMHVVDIQLTVVELLGTPPLLPFRRVRPWTAGLSAKQRLKATGLNMAGVAGLCKVYLSLKRLWTHRS